MPIADRAAQFAPFAALTGYGEQIKETARTTEEFHQVSGCLLYTSPSPRDCS